MSDLINIAAEGKSPLFLDPASVTSMMVLPEKKEMTVNNEKGQLLYINYESYGIDPAGLIDKLKAAGNDLVTFPARWPSNTEEGKFTEYAHYISPKAVTFVTMTEVSPKDGNIGVIVGVKGEGRVESYGTKPDEIGVLLDAVNASKTMMKFTPDMASARWYNPAALYVDPASVNTIRGDGMQVNVYFDASGSLDVQTKTYSTEEQQRDQQRESDMLNKLWNERRKDGATNLNDVYYEVKRIMEAEQEAKRTAIADAIAAANPALKKVEGTKFSTYLRPENYAYITFYDDNGKDTRADYKYSMSFHPQKSQSNPYPDEVRAYFNSAAKRADAFTQLTGQKPPVQNPPASSAATPTP